MDQDPKEPREHLSNHRHDACSLPSVGDLVYSTDGAELGTVEAVVRGSPAQSSALIIIAKGIFLDSCRCVALERVLSVQDGIVTLDLKARQVEHLPPCQTANHAPRA